MKIKIKISCFFILLSRALLCPAMAPSQKNSAPLDIYATIEEYIQSGFEEKITPQRVADIIKFCHIQEHIDDAFLKNAETNNVNNVYIADVLLLARADINFKTDSGSSSLHLACYNNDFALAKFLIAKGIEINCKNLMGKTALMIAAQFGSSELVELLLRKGAQINFNENHCSALHHAILNSIKNFNKIDMDDCLKKINFLLDYGSNLNVTYDGYTPLQLAMNLGKQEIVNLIKESRISELPPALEMSIQSLTINYRLSIKENFEKDLLDQVKIICMDEHKDLVKSLILVKLGELIKIYYSLEEINNEFFQNAAAQEIELGLLNTIDRAQILLKAGALINIRNKHGATPLHNAAYNGSLNLVKFLIENGARVTQSVLNYAIFSEKNNFEIVKALLNAGVHLTLNNSFEATPKPYQLTLSPLDQAEVRGKDDIAELIKQEMRKQGLIK